MWAVATVRGAGFAVCDDRIGLEFDDVCGRRMVFPDGLRNVRAGRSRFPAAGIRFVLADRGKPRQHARDFVGLERDDCGDRVAVSIGVAADHRSGRQIQVRAGGKRERHAEYPPEPDRAGIACDSGLSAGAPADYQLADPDVCRRRAASHREFSGAKKTEFAAMAAWTLGGNRHDRAGICGFPCGTRVIRFAPRGLHWFIAQRGSDVRARQRGVADWPAVDGSDGGRAWLDYPAFAPGGTAFRTVPVPSPAAMVSRDFSFPDFPTRRAGIT